MRLQDYDTSERFTGTVVATHRITPPSSDEVREIILDVDSADLDLVPGRTVGVLAPGQAEFGQDHHFRLYTVADLPEHDGAHTRIKLAVKRCFYIDSYSGERFEGRASNYLCDLREGDTLQLTGPYGFAFEVPAEPQANLILIGMGTGIAPFRAFLRHLYEDETGFQGSVQLFHGGRTGMDLLYQNDEGDDFTQYYDRATFEAIKVLSRRPTRDEGADWGSALEARGEKLWELLGRSDTYVYVAGLENIRDELDKVFTRIAGSADRWQRRKAELIAGHRWVELVY